jgi:hypothetical protein
MEPLELETAIFERLKDAAQTQGLNAVVELFPETGDYTLTHPFGAILLRYDSSQDDNSIGQRQFQSTLQFHVTVYHRKLRDAGAMYELLKFVRNCLTGYAPESFNFLKRTSEEFTAKVGDVWVFGQRYEISTTIVMGE